jgi:putative ABC transport system permease protein
MRRFLLQSWLWKPKVEDEVADEVAFHLEMRVREYLARGFTPEEARRAALARFGDLDRTRAVCQHLGHQRDRTMRRHRYLAELRQDLVFALRQLWKTPGFTLVAMLTLALGIGATGSIFSVVHAVVLRPLTVPAPERLVDVWETWRDAPTSASVSNFTSWREGSTDLFEAMAGVVGSSFNFSDTNGAERIVGQRVTGDYFKVFGVNAMLGRTFGLAEDKPGSEQVVVLTEQLWRRRFAADPEIIGREIRMNGRPYQVIGVMPAAFKLTLEGSELWVPAAFTTEEVGQTDRHYVAVPARLKPGVTHEQALAQLSQIAAQQRKAYPRDNATRGVTIVDFTTDFLGAYRERLFVLLGAVALVLLIACGNVANLLLARGAVRVQELAMRAALGAGRGRLLRQLLTESLVLAALGAAGGLVVAMLAIQAFIALSPPGVPRLEQARLDPLTLAVTMAMAIASSVIFGLMPALRGARIDAHDVLRSGLRGGGMAVARDRVRQALIIAEVALALLLLVGAGLLIRTSMAMQRVDMGFDPEGVLSARVSLPRDSYSDVPRTTLALQRMAEEVRRIPGVDAASIVSQAPLGGGGVSNGLIPEGRPVSLESAISSRFRLITPDYLQAMRIPLTRGRAFTSGDSVGAQKVMIISETLARRAFPNQDPVGKRIACCEFLPDGKTPVWKLVVGVAGDVHASGPADPAPPEFYLPLEQAPQLAFEWTQRTMFLVARTTQPPAAIVAEMRQAIARVDPTLLLFDIRTMDERVSGAMATRRFNTALLATLGAVGLLLAAIGIYGVIAYFVSQRTPEIGVRLALGASQRDVLMLVVRQALRPVLIGVGLGLALAVPAARLLESQLFGVTAKDPFTLVGVTLMLVIVAIAASLAPASRAARVDPTRALNQ